MPCTSPLPSGTRCYGTRTTSGRSLTKGIQYAGRHEPLVSPELFQRVQDTLAERSVNTRRDRTHFHYLKNIVYCGRCDARGIRAKLIYTDAKGTGGQYAYYFRRNRKKGACDLPYLPTWAVEDHVSDVHAGLTLDRGFFDDVLRLIEATLSDEKASTRQLHERLERGLARLDVKEERLIDLAADGELPMEKIKQRIASIATERIRIRSELAKSGSQLSVGAEALRLAIGLLRDLPGIYGQHGAEVRQASTTLCSPGCTSTRTSPE